MSASRARRDAEIGEPRVRPLPSAAVNENLAALLVPLGEAASLRIFRTLARHPVLLERWIPFGNYLLKESSLPARDREIAILRIGWLCDSVYELEAHLPIARAVGISEDDLDHITGGAASRSWSERDALLLRAVDGLRFDSALSDAIWASLQDIYTLGQILDLIFTVGQYQLVSTLTNALRLGSEGSR